MPGGFGLIARLYEGGLARLDAMRGVGFSLCRVVRDESELLSIGVERAYRRRGVAGYLLRASMERARAIGARQMFLEVAIDNMARSNSTASTASSGLEHARNTISARTATGRPPTRCAAVSTCEVAGTAGGGLTATSLSLLADTQLEQVAVQRRRLRISWP